MDGYPDDLSEAEWTEFLCDFGQAIADAEDTVFESVPVAQMIPDSRRYTACSECNPMSDTVCRR